MEAGYSLRSPAVKRLMKEAQELKDPTEQFFAQPLDDNLFEWHFTIRGPADSEFESGIYHGRIVLPPEYPMKPPSIILLTPNGRFETNTKICLSISGHHPESWQPSWSLRTALLAIIGFMPTHGNGAIGSLDYTSDERITLARKSLDWNCSNCGPVQKLVLPVTEASKALNKEAKELGTKINLQGEKEKSAATPASSSPPTGITDLSSGARDESPGAAGPSLPPSDAVPSFPTFPYPFDPRLMFPTNAGQPPNAAGCNPLNPNNPVAPSAFVPPFFLPNMLYNPFFMYPWPPGLYAPQMYAPQGFPPGYRMPGFWMPATPFPPLGTVPGIGDTLPLNTLGQPLKSTVKTSTSTSSTGLVSSAGGGSQSSANQSTSRPEEVSVQNQSADVNTASASSSLASRAEVRAPVSEEPSSSSARRSFPQTALGHSDAGASSAETVDPVPSAGKVRQRNATRELNRPSRGRMRRAKRRAEIRPDQSSSAYDVCNFVLNFTVAILVLCVVALLIRRLFLLG